MKKENILKLKKLLIIFCLLLVVTLIIFVFVAKKDQQPTEEEVIENVSKYDKHTSYDGLFTIETPNTWQEVVTKNSLNANAILELEKTEDNAYLVVVVNNKIDLNEDFATFKTNVFKQKEAVYKTTISSYTDTTINNYSAQYATIYYTNSNNINTYIRAYAFETENYYGQIVIWTLASNEESVQKEFDNITTSFKEI